MAEPFKEWMNVELLKRMGGIFNRVYPAFDEKSFIDDASDGLSGMELKARTLHIMHVLDKLLPSEFDAFAEVALAALHPSEDSNFEDVDTNDIGLKGFAAWPLTDLVTKRGLDCPEQAMPVLKEVTKRFTAEFAIRPFLQNHTDYTLGVLESWLGDSNRHVRRLISEGTRPRLPWGMRLQQFVIDPGPILPLLEALKDDEEEYVRRSVANNLNDIAKDHETSVSNIAKRWLKGASKNRTRLVRHACRTLIKQGHKEALEAFGYTAVSGLHADLKITTPVVQYGDAAKFALEITGGPENHKVMVDYAVHFVKASGQTSPKVFKWKDTILDGKGKLSALKKHAIKPITTRVYYGGVHYIEVFVNGISVAKEAFELKL